MIPQNRVAQIIWIYWKLHDAKVKLNRKVVWHPKARTKHLYNNLPNYTKQNLTTSFNKRKRL